MYIVTKTFISGLLAGITITEKTSVAYKIGYICRKPLGGSAYRIDKVEQA